MDYWLEERDLATILKIRVFLKKNCDNRSILRNSRSAGARKS